MAIPPSLPIACMKPHSLLNIHLLRCPCQHVWVPPITAESLWQVCRYIISPQGIDVIHLFLIFYGASPMTSKSLRRNAAETERQSFCEPCPTSLASYQLLFPNASTCHSLVKLPLRLIVTFSLTSCLQSRALFCHHRLQWNFPTLPLKFL